MRLHVSVAILILLTAAIPGTAEEPVATVTDSQLQRVLDSVVKNAHRIKEGQFEFPYGTDARITVLNKGSSLILGAKFRPSRPVEPDQLHALHGSLRYVRLMQFNDGTMIMLADHLTSGGVTEANLKAWLEVVLGQLKVARENLSKQ